MVGDALSFMRAHPVLITIFAAVALVALLFTGLAVMMSRAGVSLRPLVFVGVFLAIVGGPQVAFHLAQACGWIPQRDLTWGAGQNRAGDRLYVENETVLAATGTLYDDPTALFGPDADPTLISDLSPLGSDGPFGNAQVVQMAVLRSGATSVVARYADARDAHAAAERYFANAIGWMPRPAADGAWAAQRLVGDYVRVLVVGRTLLALTGDDAAALSASLSASPALSPPGTAAGNVSLAGNDFWLYRPPVLVALTLLLAALATVWFFKGTTWAASVAAKPGAEVLPAHELRARLLAVNTLDVPFSVTEEPGGRVVVTWRFADARWVDAARAHGMRTTHRLLLHLDEARSAVRATEQFSSLDWSVGATGASMQWKGASGVVLFQHQHHRVFGLQIDEHGRLQPQPSYAYTFNLKEMKSPFIAATTSAGWSWRPAAWHGPRWARWLTD